MNTVTWKLKVLVVFFIKQFTSFKKLLYLTFRPVFHCSLIANIMKIYFETAVVNQSRCVLMQHTLSSFLSTAVSKVIIEQFDTAGSATGRAAGL